MTVGARGIAGAASFPATSWSVIRQARDPAGPAARRQLERLIRLYWQPVFVAVRSTSARSDDEARDLTQSFFAEVVLDGKFLRAFAPERGSFRSFLRAALTRFVGHERRDARRLKRGGGAATVPFDERTGHAGQDAGPEELFERAWNEAVIAEAKARTEQQLRAAGKEIAFRILARYDLEDGDGRISYAELGAELGMSVPRVKHALLEARAALRAAVVEVVRDTVDSPAALAAELRAVLRSR